jgi:hypothetical protein
MAIEGRLCRHQSPYAPAASALIAGQNGSATGIREQNDVYFAAQLLLRRVSRRTFWHEDGDDPSSSELAKTLAVPQNLTQPETQLDLFVVSGDALDLCNKGGSICLPGKIKIRLGIEEVMASPRMATINADTVT